VDERAQVLLLQLADLEDPVAMGLEVGRLVGELPVGADGEQVVVQQAVERVDVEIGRASCRERV